MNFLIARQMIGLLFLCLFFSVDLIFADSSAENLCVFLTQDTRALNVNKQELVFQQGTFIRARRLKKSESLLATEVDGELFVFKKDLSKMKLDVVCPESEVCAKSSTAQPLWTHEKGRWRSTERKWMPLEYPVFVGQISTSKKTVSALRFGEEGVFWLVAGNSETSFQTSECPGVQVNAKKELKSKLDLQVSFFKSFNVSASGFKNVVSALAQTEDFASGPDPLITGVDPGAGQGFQACLRYHLSQWSIGIRGCGQYHQYRVSYQGKNNPDPNPPSGTRLEDLSAIRGDFQVNQFGLDTSLFLVYPIGRNYFYFGPIGVRGNYTMTDRERLEFRTGPIIKGTVFEVETGPPTFGNQIFSYFEYEFRFEKGIQGAHLGFEWSFDQQYRAYLGLSL